MITGQEYCASCKGVEQCHCQVTVSVDMTIKIAKICIVSQMLPVNRAWLLPIMLFDLTLNKGIHLQSIPPPHTHTHTHTKVTPRNFDPQGIMGLGLTLHIHYNNHFVRFKKVAVPRTRSHNYINQSCKFDKSAAQYDSSAYQYCTHVDDNDYIGGHYCSRIL